MLAYAPRRHDPAARPGLFALILIGHVAIIGAVMATKLVVDKTREPPIKIFPIDEDLPPPPEPPRAPEPPQPPRQSHIAKIEPLVALPPTPGPAVVPIPQPPISFDPVPGPSRDPVIQPRQADIERHAARLITSGDALRPPYPEAMRASEREAVLRLTLSIDERGRVVAVDPVGSVEPAFLDSARRHITRTWRYAPATEDGRKIRSTVTITLKFEIGDA